MLRARKLALGFAAAAILVADGADADRAGDFDYYVLALSWSASWCELRGDETRAPQCRSDRSSAFVLHGFWPQYEEGWPEYCTTSVRDPSRGDTAAMADIMGSAGAAWHQWKKHGRCSGLPSAAYFQKARQALARVVMPPVLTGLDRRVAVPPSVIEEAFLETNPDLVADGVTVTCDDGLIGEVRLCLTRDLEFRACAPDTRRDCRASSAIMPAVR